MLALLTIDVLFVFEKKCSMMNEKTNKNNNFAEIWEALTEGSKVLMFPHVLLDGDAIGSCVALCEGLRNSGYDAYVIIEDKIPQNIELLAEEYIVDIKDYDIKDYDIKDNEDTISVLVDCGDYTRIPKRKELCENGKKLVIIDHHKTTQYIGDCHYIDSQAAAAAEIIFDILEQNNVEITEKIATALYTGILTDTGNFQNANTTKRTHEIVAKLYDVKEAFRDVNVAVNENVPFRALKIRAKLTDKIELLADGKVAILSITEDFLREMGCTIEDVESTSVIVRSIQGVEVGAVLKEKDDAVKVSLRAKTYFDVAKLAQKYGGGGHVKAAGFTSTKSIVETAKLLQDELEETFK